MAHRANEGDTRDAILWFSVVSRQASVRSAWVETDHAGAAGTAWWPSRSAQSRRWSAATPPARRCSPSASAPSPCGTLGRARPPPFGWMPRRASYFWPALYWQAQDGELAAAWCLWFAGLVVGWSPPRCWKCIFEILSDERLSFVSGVPLEVLLRVLNIISSPQPHPWDAPVARHAFGPILCAA